MSRKKRPVNNHCDDPGYFEKIFPLKPGVLFSDLLMDGQQMLQEIYITQRALQYYRDSNKISYTSLWGKYYYFRIEIAEMVKNNIIWRRKT